MVFEIRLQTNKLSAVVVYSKVSSIYSLVVTLSSMPHFTGTEKNVALVSSDKSVAERYRPLLESELQQGKVTVLSEEELAHNGTQLVLFRNFSFAMISFFRM
jgi:hypothetical protein